MAVTATPIYPQALVNAVQTIAPADTTAVKTIVAAGTNGTKVERILITSTEPTTVRDVVLYWTISATNYTLGIFAIPALAGTADTIPTISLFDLVNNGNAPMMPLCYDTNGNRYMYLASGTTLSISCTTTVTTAQKLTICCQGGNF